MGMVMRWGESQVTESGECVTPCTRHVCTHSSLCISTSPHPFSHVCHPLHATPAFQNLSPTSVVHLHMSMHSWHATSMHHGAHHSCISTQHFHICCSFLQSQYDLHHAPHVEMCAMSAPAYAPTEFSLPFVKYHGLKFIVQYCCIPQAIVACQE